MVTTTVRIKKRDKVRLVSSKMIGIHTMEAPEGPQTAENVAKYFDGVRADSHWCIDNNSRVRVIEDEYIAWTTPGLNSRSRNIELAGYAKQTTADWNDAYSLAMLEIAALSAAEWCIKDNIPVRRLTDKQIANYEPGFFGHVDANRVFKKSSHWDPGPAFPWDYFLGRVRAKIEEVSGKAPQGAIVPQAPAATYDNKGYSVAYIKARQTQLNKLGYKLEEDGKRGPATIAAVTDFQKKHGLDPDGIPGPKTTAALDKAIAAKNKSATPPPAPKPAARPNCEALQVAVKAAKDNRWGPDTDKKLLAVRAASAWAGHKFPYGVAFAQSVVGTKQDSSWGPNSRAAHDKTVLAIQNALNAMGFNCGKPDGLWGPKTEAAFQAARKACRI